MTHREAAIALYQRWEGLYADGEMTARPTFLYFQWWLGLDDDSRYRWLDDISIRGAREVEYELFEAHNNAMRATERSAW